MTSERKLYLKTFLAIVIGMGLALGVIRTIAWLGDASGSLFFGRVVEAQAALPRILEEEEGELVMFFGSSMTDAGFSARHFDRELRSRDVAVSSWNFGFGGLNPYFQNILSRRIREAFEARDRRLKLALIEFNPFQATKTRWQRAQQIKDSLLPMLSSDRELLNIALHDPERGALLFTIHYLRDNVSAEMITTEFASAFQAPAPRSELPPLDTEQQARLDELGEILAQRFNEEYPDFQGGQWVYEWQGAGTVPWERPASTVALFPEYYTLIRNPRFMDNDRLRRIRTADILELDFEEQMIRDFISIVGNFQAISDHVEVILLPRNTDWINYTPEVAARLQSVIDRIARETGVPVRNHQALPEMRPDMFGDTTHLGRYIGDIPYTEYLVDSYAPLLSPR